MPKTGVFDNTDREIVRVLLTGFALAGHLSGGVSNEHAAEEAVAAADLTLAALGSEE